MDENDIKNLTPAIKADRVRGSKWVFVSEHSFLLAIYAMKACMLVIYARITYDSLSSDYYSACLTMLPGKDYANENG